MKTLPLAAADLDFNAALKLAQASADQELGDNMLLSWYDRERDLESPRGASECHEGCPTKGYWDYALNRGGKLAVNFDQGRFVFCFQPLDEFI
ncbi:MAG: AF1514 family protein [Sulfuricella sp.]|nr:AF1514 family protein [Sulfuricella sp.]